MKTFLFLVVAILLAATGPLFAQTSGQPATVVTEPEAIGVVTGYNATTQVLVIAMGDSGTPKTFMMTNTTRLMDASGSPAQLTALQNGAAVTVNFTPSGDRLIATKVIITPVLPKPTPPPQ